MCIRDRATEGQNFCFWVQRYNMDDIDNYKNQLNEEIVNVDEYAELGESMYQRLRGRQLEILDRILSAAEGQSEQRCFIIDGPGGAGKTFIYKTLFHILSGRNWANCGRKAILFWANSRVVRWRRLAYGVLNGRSMEYPKVPLG